MLLLRLCADFLQVNRTDSMFGLPTEISAFYRNRQRHLEVDRVFGSVVGESLTKKCHATELKMLSAILLIVDCS